MILHLIEPLTSSDLLASNGAEIRAYPPLEELVSEDGLTTAGEQLLSESAAATAILCRWDLKHAPRINTLGFALRKAAVCPLVALTGEREEEPAALAAGADASTASPARATLVAAIALAYRRMDVAIRGLSGVDNPDPSEWRVGNVRLDRRLQAVFVNEEPLQLTPRESLLLTHLVHAGDQLCSRESLLEHVWGITFDTGTNMVDVYVHFLRRKLSGAGADIAIETVRGFGYRLAAEAPDD